jgi:hypothetical protein
VASPVTPATEDPVAAANALIEQGIDLRQAQRDAEALALFEKAQGLAPSPRGQAQIALAQQALGRWAPAERSLKAALVAVEDTWIASRRPILDRALSVIQTHLGDVELVGATVGVVYVDGVRVEDQDALTHLRLEVGWRTIEVRAEGMYPVSRKVEVLAGETDRIEVAQRPLLEDPAASNAARLPVPLSPDTGRAQRTIGWALLGGAGLFVATGVAGLIERDVVAGDFNSNSACTGTLPPNLRSPCSNWLSDGTTAETVAIVGFVGGGLFAAISATLLLTAPSAKPKARAAATPWTCAAAPGGAWCGVTGTF